ncbi:jg14018 [Pararge aegeria aegeria]|uniref:Jg14018 protein n=1 Tax=Pararge aegeria aegeria TaxID=348720 RepID=A0A8S4R6V2_9NEOP|nr:jg14018 [Pararge aegeria aegeria]
MVDVAGKQEQKCCFSHAINHASQLTPPKIISSASTEAFNHAGLLQIRRGDVAGGGGRGSGIWHGQLTPLIGSHAEFAGK